MNTDPRDDGPDEKASISDEQWESFLREAEEGGSVSVPKEPSARARMVTQRLREQDEAARCAKGGGRWRGRGKTAHDPHPATPPGWRTGPAWQEINGTRDRRRKLWSAFGVVLALAVVVVALRPSLLLDRLPVADSASDVSPTPLSAETALPSSAPGNVDGLPTTEHPFRGSPAVRWADGADAIEVPTAKAVSGLSKDDVALALRRTKEFLVASSLDPAVLRGGQPDKALALLDPEQPDMLSDLRRSLRRPSKTHDPVGLFSRFDPGEVRLAGDVVKVRGHMSYSAGEPGQVLVHADYSFVYPLVRPDGGDTVARTIVRRDLTLSLSDPSRWIATKGKLSVREYAVDTFNNECDVYDGYLHPVFPDGEPTGGPATGAAKDPYDRSESLVEQNHEGCGQVTRT
ncbi:hypothetical protein [Streptomyces tailanensis]|uniref:hypothetical protein n=1 Tax=Streptomyces tailanensis TaxID=2569858 RepID=UPI00122E6FD0|nr:hypothetical protein [Streptomyces tailanensis]